MATLCTGARARSVRVLAILTLVLVSLLLTVSAQADDVCKPQDGTSTPVSITYNAEYVVADVPVNITLNTTSIMFASTDNCATVLSKTRAYCDMNDLKDPLNMLHNTCRFTIEKELLQFRVSISTLDPIKKVQLCIQKDPSKADDTCMAPLPLTTIAITPAYMSPDSVLTFSSNTPIGTQIGYRMHRSNEFIFIGKLDSTRTFKPDKALVSLRSIEMGIKADVAGGGTANWGTQFIVPSLLHTDIQLKYIIHNVPATIDFGLEVNPSKCSLTLHTDCTVIGTTYDVVERNVAITTTLSANTYTLCCNGNMDVPSVYMPLGTLRVIQYHFNPTSVYANMPIATFVRSDNGGAEPGKQSFMTYAATDDKCRSKTSGEFWLNDGERRTFAYASGTTVYTCVTNLTNNVVNYEQAAMTETVTVFSAPKVTMKYAVSGVGASIHVASASLSGKKILIILTTDGTCTDTQRTASIVDANAGDVTMAMPSGAKESITLCATAPLTDEQAKQDPATIIGNSAIGLYKFVEQNTATFALSYDALVVNRPVNIGFDRRLSLQTGKFVLAPPGRECEDQGNANYDASTRFVVHTFTTNGTWRLCLCSDVTAPASGSCTPLRQMQVHASATVEPSVRIKNLTSDVVVGGTSANLPVYLSTDACNQHSSTDTTPRKDPPVARGTTDKEGSVTIPVCDNLDKPLHVCIEYTGYTQNDDGSVSEVTTTLSPVDKRGAEIMSDVEDVRVVPGIVSPDQTMVVYFNVSVPSQLDGVRACLLDTTTCADSTTCKSVPVTRGKADGATCAQPPHVLFSDVAKGQHTVHLFKQGSCTSPASCTSASVDAAAISVGVMHTERLIDGLPSMLSFGGKASVLRADRQFAIIKDASKCDSFAPGDVAARGTLVSTAGVAYESSVFTTSFYVATPKVCVEVMQASADQATCASYAYVSDLLMMRLATQSKYVYNGTVNLLGFNPDITGRTSRDDDGAYQTTVYLVAPDNDCSMSAASKPIFVRPDEALSVTIGSTYAVCVRRSLGLSDGTVKAIGTVKALRMWDLKLSREPLRQYVPFNAMLQCPGQAKDCSDTADPHSATTASASLSGADEKGGTSPARPAESSSTQSYKLVVVEATQRCSSVDVSSGVDIVPEVNTPMSITDIDAVANVIFCLAVENAVVELSTKQLLMYVDPGYIIAGEKTHFAHFTDSSTARGTLTRTKSCTTAASGGSDIGMPVRPVSALDFNLPKCDDDSATPYNTVYYCESAGNGSPFEHRATLPVLRRDDCEHTHASIRNVVANPGEPIADFGLSTMADAGTRDGGASTSTSDKPSILFDPRLYRDASCTDPIEDAFVAPKGASDSRGASQTQYIFTPKYNQTVSLYVCARVRYTADSAPRFTTTHPTLTVANWHVTPLIALSNRNCSVMCISPTKLTISVPIHTEGPFLSTSDSCSKPLTDASGFYRPTTAASAASTLPATMMYNPGDNVNDIIYVCAFAPQSTNGKSTPDESAIAVAAFLSVTEPIVSSISTLVMRGLPFNVEFSPTHSMTTGALMFSMNSSDKVDPKYSSYLTPQTPSYVFLSSGDDCTKPLTRPQLMPAGSSTAHIDLTTVTGTIPDKVLLCTNTSLGVRKTRYVQSTNRDVWPATYTAYSESTMQIPRHKDTKVMITAKSSGCTAKCDTPGVLCSKTDANGNMTLYVEQNAASALDDERNVCVMMNGAYVKLDQIQINYNYNVNAEVFFTNVNSSVELLGGLKWTNLHKGLFDASCGDRACEPAAGTDWYGSSASPSTIYVTSAKQAGPLQLHVAFPDASVMSLPRPPRSIRFVNSPLTQQLNVTLRTCSPLRIDRCYVSKDAEAPTDAELVVVDGDCCAKPHVLARTPLSNSQCTLDLGKDPETAQLSHTVNVSVCVWSASNANYCPTVARTKLETSCASADISGGSSLLPGWLIAVIVVSILVGLLLLALLIYLLCVFCCRPRRRSATIDKNHQLVALRQMEPSEFDYSVGGEYSVLNATGGAVGAGLSSAGMPGWTAGGISTNAISGSRHPLLYYPAASGVGGAAFASGGEDSSSPTSTSGLRGMVSGSGNNMQQPMDSMGNGSHYHFHQQQMHGVTGTSIGMAANASISTTTRPSLMEGFEDEERDEVALQEARERYHMRVAFAEELERLRLLAKETEVIVGYEDADERLFVANAAPELRSMDVLDADADERQQQQQQQQQQQEKGHQSAAQHEANSNAGEVVDVFAGGAGPDDGADDDAFAPLNFDQGAAVDGAAGGGATATRTRGGAGAGASDLDSDASMSQLARMLGGDETATHTGGSGVAAQQDKSHTRSSPSLSPAGGRQSHIHFDTTAPTTEARGDGSGNGTAARPLDDDDDDDMDELSFTTTQRFHDEKRFLLEQEDIRRQRLSNWEDEERALLAQDELNDYMQVVTTATANNSSNTNNTATLPVDYAATRAANADETVYHAPRIPAQPPQLTSEVETAREKTQRTTSHRRRSQRSSSHASDSRRRGGSRSSRGGSTTLGSIDQLNNELYPNRNAI